MGRGGHYGIIPENTANTYTWYTETLDCCFDLTRSHQQCIPWFPPLEVEPATTDCSAETLQLSHQFISHTSDSNITSHGNCTAIWPKCVLQVTSVLFTEDMATQLPWLVNLALLMCHMNWWLSCRVSVLQSVVAGSISSGGDHSIHCWWDLIRSKQLSSVSAFCA